MTGQFILTSAEKASPVWRRLLGHFEQQRDVCRAKNDGPLNEIETAEMRGRIAVYKALVGLDEYVPVTDE